MCAFLDIPREKSYVPKSYSCSYYLRMMCTIYLLLWVEDHASLVQFLNDTAWDMAIACSLSLDQVHILSTCNARHQFSFRDAVAEESGMHPGHQENCSWRIAAVFGYSQTDALPIYGSPFLKNNNKQTKTWPIKASTSMECLIAMLNCSLWILPASLV